MRWLYEQYKTALLKIEEVIEVSIDKEADTITINSNTDRAVFVM